MRLVLSPFARVTLRIEVAIETDNTETPPTNLTRVTLRRQTFLERDSVIRKKIRDELKFYS